MSEHTPGPWEASSLGIWAKSPWNARVCLAQAHNFSPMNKVDSAANARLMAAAPDLLDALKAVVSVADRKTVEFDMARAAIAKATNG